MRTLPGAGNALAPERMASDLGELRSILIAYLGALPPEGWERPTERRGGWTLRQTLAHVTASAAMFDRALERTLAGEAVTYPGLTGRNDLPAMNERNLAALERAGPGELVASLAESLAKTAHRAAALRTDQLLLQAPMPAYNRPLTVAELVGTQLAHVGIVHAAQLGRGAGEGPLWTRYAPDLTRRQITRFFHMLSHTYWPERGRGLVATVNFSAAGAAGGTWHVVMRPDGGSCGEGPGKRPRLRIWTRNADALLRLFTQQVSIVGALATGRMMAWGDLPLGFRLPHLFLPT